MLLQAIQAGQLPCIPVLARFLTAGTLGLMLCLAGPHNTFAIQEEIENGRRIALQGTKEVRCARCHGKLGQGDGSEGHPRIGGQSRFYLQKQLEDFASGTRPSEEMVPVARVLTEKQRAAVAAYYASIKNTPYPPRPEGEPRLLQQGGILSAIGSDKRSIRACALCHATAGAGIPPSYPYLAGQFASYTERQLQLWKRGLRQNDSLELMAEIAKKLSDEEIRGLALYFARVRLPAKRINSLTEYEP
ncbi:c-type cytochrome [Nitrosococcus wardiae]|uniref:C-type cytochrome n=1 Tax=Nitrosococcus wardiae TaxID=1814290 RepID=A0A4P7C218_9GAMM|nr:c-type cytochrome [Nitrosococcus wardiae]QBQ55749.1 c-type cytochrome [Nitrosococcus wardiae]